MVSRGGRHFYLSTRKEKDMYNRKKLIYVCSPYAGDVEANIEAAKRYCRFVISKGFIPFATHLLYPQILDDNNPEERALGMTFGNIIMDHCLKIWVFGDEISKGMAEEIRYAVTKNYCIRYFTETFKEDE